MALELDLPEAAIAEGLRAARWPARMQRLAAGPYGEAAKVAGEQGGRALAGRAGTIPMRRKPWRETLSERQAKAPRPLALIVGMLANKDAGGFFEALKGTDAAVFTVLFDGACRGAWPRWPLWRAGHGLAATPTGSATEALDLALRLGAGRVVICGSLYLAGEVLACRPARPGPSRPRVRSRIRSPR